ncbi:MAG: BRO family protein [Aeromonas jandaei]
MELSVIKTEVILGKELRVFGDIDNPLFLAKDIAEWIEHSNVSKMCQCLCNVSNITSDNIGNSGGKEGITSGYTLTKGGRQEMKFLTEKQVYRILMRSDKPIAIQIQDGIFEFLKAWRKGEVKVVQNEVRVDSYMIADPIERAKAWIIEEEKRIALSNKIKEDAPKVEVYDFIDSSNWLSGEDITKMTAIKGLTRNKMYCWLRYRGHFTKRNIPSSAMVEAKMCKLSPTSKKDFHGNVIQRPVFSMDFLQQIIKLHKDGKLNIEEAIKYEKDEKERNKKRYNEDIIFSI